MLLGTEAMIGHILEYDEDQVGALLKYVETYHKGISKAKVGEVNALENVQQKKLLLMFYLAKVLTNILVFDLVNKNNVF